jgi:hypothetical protein
MSQSERDVRARKDSNNLCVRILCAQLPNLIVTAGGCWPILCVPFTKTTPHFPFTRPVYLQKYILHTVTWHAALGSARTLALVLATAAANRDGKLPLSCVYIARADFWWIFLFHHAARNAHLYAKRRGDVCVAFSVSWIELERKVTPITSNWAICTQPVSVFYIGVLLAHTNTPRCTPNQRWWKTRGVLLLLLVWCE